MYDLVVDNVDLNCKESLLVVFVKKDSLVDMGIFMSLVLRGWVDASLLEMFTGKRVPNNVSIESSSLVFEDITVKCHRKRVTGRRLVTGIQVEILSCFTHSFQTK